MALLTNVPKPDDWHKEGYYNTDYQKWNGFVCQIPLLESIISIRAASIMCSWKTEGTHAEQAAEMLDNWDGRGNQGFKELLKSMYSVAYICGDSYAEIIRDGDSGPITNLIILPSDNIQLVIKDGRIKSYKEKNTQKEFSPDKIFHLRYGTRGASVHGSSKIEGMNNILISFIQMQEQGDNIFRLFSKPRALIHANSDRKADLDKIAERFADKDNLYSAVTVLPATLIGKVEKMDLSMPLNPGDWLKVIQEQIMMATQTSNLVLGGGYSTSEEDAKTRLGGFRQSIRYDQKWLEEAVQTQLFRKMWKTNPPTLKLSYATESQDERFNRDMEAIQIINGLNITPENKTAIFEDLMVDAGVVED